MSLLEYTLSAGDYYLQEFEGEEHEDWPFFLYNKDGEGVSLSQKDVAEILERAFKEHF